MPKTKEELKRERDRETSLELARKRITQIVDRLGEGIAQYEDIQPGASDDIFKEAAKQIVDVLHERRSNSPLPKERACLGQELAGLVAYVRYMLDELD